MHEENKSPRFCPELPPYKSNRCITSFSSTQSLLVQPGFSNFSTPDEIASFQIERLEINRRKIVVREFICQDLSMERPAINYSEDQNLKATELRLGLPGSDEPEKQYSAAKNNKRASPEISEESRSNSRNEEPDCAPPAKQQIVGWPPIRSYRKNSIQLHKKSEGESGGMYVKVSVDGAPYLRKIDLKMYKSYPELLKALENMFKLTIGEYSEREGYNGSDHAPTYEDKDGDWMLVGDVPWEMFISSCKRLRIMRGSEARGLACP